MKAAWWPRSGLLVFLLLLSASRAGTAQSAMDLVGSARATALGNATTALANDAGIQANPAATRTTRLLQFFARQAYGLAELRQASVHAILPWSRGVITGGAGTFGFDAYRESYFSVGAAYGARLGTSRVAQLGLRMRYYHTRITGYGQAGALGISLGSQVRLLPTLHLGVIATNLNAPRLADDVALPQSLAVGLAYQASDQITILFDTMKDIDFPLAVRGGLEITLLPALAIRTGFSTAPLRYTAGAGVQVGRLTAHVAAEQHDALGWSPSLSVQVRW